MGNDEFGIWMFASAIDERCRTSSTLFHPLAVFFQDERIVVVPRITVYFRIVAALPLHAEASWLCGDERDCDLYYMRAINSRACVSIGGGIGGGVGR